MEISHSIQNEKMPSLTLCPLYLPISQNHLSSTSGRYIMYQTLEGPWQARYSLTLVRQVSKWTTAILWGKVHNGVSFRCNEGSKEAQTRFNLKIAEAYFNKITGFQMPQNVLNFKSY